MREPFLFVFGAAAIWTAVWLARPSLGPATAWLPWLAWAALSAAASAQPLAALPPLARWSTALAFASLAGAWDKDGRQGWLLTAAFSTAVLAAAALVTGAPFGFGPHMTGLIPAYYNYTSFALAAGAAGAAAWALHPETRGSRFRTAAFVGAAALAVCVLLARSRGASLGLVAAGAVWAARRLGAKAALASFFVAALAGSVFQAGLLPPSWRSVLVKEGRRYEEVRPQIWRSALAVAGESPWFGEGPGSFGVGFRRHPVETRGGAGRWGMGTDYAHSEPLQAAGETGRAGLALWLLAMGASMSALLRRADAEPAREAAAVAAAAMAAQLGVDNMLQLPGLALLFFSALAVAGAGAGSSPERRWPRAAVAAGGLLALGFWIPREWAKADPGRAVALFPAESELREDLAYRLAAEGKTAEADRAWEQAARLSPFNAVYLWRRAQIAATRADWGAAEALMARALELEPGFLDGRVLRAEALHRLGRTSEARAELAAVERAAREPVRPASSDYDERLVSFDAGEFARTAALIGRARKQ